MRIAIENIKPVFNRFIKGVFREMKKTIFVLTAILFVVGAVIAQSYDVMLNRPDIDGLSSDDNDGTDLDDISTTGLAEGTIVIIYDGSESRIYRLEVSGDSENPPTVIRTDDWAVSGKLWRTSISSNPEDTAPNTGFWDKTGNFISVTPESIGVGTATPTEKLEVVGTVKATAFVGDGSGLTGISGDSDWVYNVSDGADTTLMTGGAWGIARSGNTLYGNADSTHVNLGVACTTGATGEDYKYCTVGGGIWNTASNTSATVGGGNQNTASNSYATVGGGATNTASGSGSVISGGLSNTATGIYTAIGGGTSNTASNQFATVGGGTNNTASGTHSSIGGGEQNTATHSYATIAGGKDNAVNGFYSAIPGGQADTVSAQYSFAFGNHVVVATDYTARFFSAAHPGSLLVGGKIRATAFVGDGSGLTGLPGGNWTETGDVLFTNDYWGIARKGNTLYGDNDSTHVNLGVGSVTGATGENYKYCTVSGGYQNTASGIVATIGGGFGNVASDMSATVSGGYTNTASGSVATVGGGASNTANGGIATVGGGTNNTASGVYSTVGGGYINTASGERSIIGGGSQNTASGNNATIGGGYDNEASGEYATIPGGYADTVSGDYSFAFGNHVVVPSNYTAQFFSAANPGSLIIGGKIRATAFVGDGSGLTGLLGDGDWTFNISDGADTTLMTGGAWGIARKGATLYGVFDSTHVNLGWFCKTGMNGGNKKYSTVSGGKWNSAGNTSASVGGGENNIASGPYSTVGGGAGNTASTGSYGYSTIGGGQNNIASGDHTTVGGGKVNTASNSYTTVGGGGWNVASKHFATVGGGSGNTASDTAATVSGGYGNTASGVYATVGGGWLNTASGYVATVGSGRQNTASDSFSVVPGGRFNDVSGKFSFAFGFDADVATDYTARFFSAANPGSLIVGGDVRIDSALFIGDVPNDATHDSVLTIDGGQVKKVAATELGGGGGGPSTIKVHRTDSLKTPIKNTWTPFNMTSKVNDESIGTDFTWPVSGDSSKVQVNSEGLYKLGGCIHFINPGNSSLSNIKVLTRILQNGTTEARCSQRDWMGDLEGKGVRHLQFTGTAYLMNGDYVQLQYYSNTDKIVFINDSAFMNSVAVTIWLEKLQ